MRWTRRTSQHWNLGHEMRRLDVLYPNGQSEKRLSRVPWRGMGEAHERA